MIVSMCIFSVKGLQQKASNDEDNAQLQHAGSCKISHHAQQQSGGHTLYASKLPTAPSRHGSQ